MTDGVAIDGFGERVTELMQINRMTQKALAKAVDVSAVTMCRYINGSRTPDCNTVYRIARALNATSDYLLGMDKGREYETTKNWIRNNAKKMTAEQKAELARLLFV